MKTPGFNAEKSLYGTGGRYRTGGKPWSGLRTDRRVLPQQNFICDDYCQDCAEHGDLSCIACSLCVLEARA
jgi:hypothetical protein